MKVDDLRCVLKTISIDAQKPHPWAEQGEWRNYLAAKDKKTGGNVHHYAEKGKLWFVPAMAKNAA